MKAQVVVNATNIQ